jgi:hypothetical protein
MAGQNLADVNGTLLPEPQANLMAVLDDFWETYAQRRESGMSQNQAVGSALRQVVPEEQLGEISQMLYGSRDRELSINGRRIRADLIVNGDAYWKESRTQTLPVVDGERSCEACGRGPAITLKLRSTGGYIVYRTLKSSRPITLCKECGLDALHHSQKVSGVGVATLNLFAPYAFAQNQKSIVRLKQLPDPAVQ